MLSMFGKACLGLPLLTLDYSFIELPVPLHGVGCLGFTPSCLSTVKLGCSVLVLDAEHFNLSLLLHSLAQLAFCLLTSDLNHSGLTMFPKCLVCFGSISLVQNDLYFPTGWAGETLSVLGRACLGLTLSTSDSVQSDLFLPLRSMT